MSEFRIETLPVAVEIGFGPGAAPAFGTIFLRPGAATHKGAETVRDRLADPSLFLPLRMTGSYETVLVAKAQIRYLRAPTPIDDDASLLERAAPRPRVLIELDTGESYGGELFLAQPPGQSRILDYLNSGDRAFLCLGQGSDDCFINRSHVRMVREPAASHTP